MRVKRETRGCYFSRSYLLSYFFKKVSKLFRNSSRHTVLDPILSLVLFQEQKYVDCKVMSFVHSLLVLIGHTIYDIALPISHGLYPVPMLQDILPVSSGEVLPHKLVSGLSSLPHSVPRQTLLTQVRFPSLPHRTRLPISRLYSSLQRSSVCQCDI